MPTHGVTWPSNLRRWTGALLPGATATRFLWSSEPATWYTLQGSTNLRASFTSITSNIRSEYPVTRCTNPLPAGPRTMFYRLYQQ